MGRITQGPPFPCWDLNASGIFSVSSYYRALVHGGSPGWDNFPSALIWLSDVPTKVSGFAWQVFHGCISTFDNLQRRGFIGPNICVLCRAGLESVSHLFLFCPFSVQVWTTFSSKLSIWGPNPIDVRGLLIEWKSRNSFSSFRIYRDRWIHAFLWVIWIERNNRIFRESVRSATIVTWYVAFLIGRWLRVDGAISDVEFRGWMDWWQPHVDPG
ncbi:Putative ribonuclease H protein At1g65750 [Linum perenne]